MRAMLAIMSLTTIFRIVRNIFRIVRDIFRIVRDIFTILNIYKSLQ